MLGATRTLTIIKTFEYAFVGVDTQLVYAATTRNDGVRGLSEFKKTKWRP